MRKLFAANFNRLRKSRSFWLILAMVSVLGVFFNLPAQWNLVEGASIEESLFQLLPYFPFVSTLFVSLFVGVEFDEHTIRNKLIVGHRRTEVFFSICITCAAACLVLLAGMLVSTSVTAVAFGRSFQCSWTRLSYSILCCVLLSLVFSTISVAFVMNIPAKPAIFLTLFFVVMLYAASFMGARLAEPEMTYDGVTITMDGGVEFGDRIKNPAYIEGTARRKMYELCYDLFPTGQAIQMNNGEFERCLRWAPLSLVVLAVSTMVGYLPFRKREIK